MPRRKKNTKVEKKSDNFFEQITQISSGLVFMSETDAEILPFIGGKTDAVNRENLLIQINKQDVNVEEQDFNSFFAPLTEMQDWFGEEERMMTDKFIQLKTFLQNNLRDLKVFKVGKINLDIYIVGLNSESVLQGVQTKATET